MLVLYTFTLAVHTLYYIHTLRLAHTMCMRHRWGSIHAIIYHIIIYYIIRIHLFKNIQLPQ